MQPYILWASLLPAACAALLAPRNTTIACNNSPNLCSRSYSNITHLGAHDSPFISNATTTNVIGDAGNQNVNSIAQLNAGVRLLTAQVHNNNGEWHLCHSSCTLLDAGSLSSWLSTIKTWLDANPNDVVTILLVNSDDATAGDLNGEFVAADITSYAYQPPSTTTALTTWPTLQEMISNNTRLVTFVASLTPSTNTDAPYLLDEFTFVFENDYNVTSASDFSCVADRPASVSGQTSSALSLGLLPLVNHFLYESAGFGIFTPDTANITTTNGRTGVGSLGVAALECSSYYGRNPAFLLVDFFDQGSTISIVNDLNGISTTATGQIQPSPVTSTSSASAGGLALGRYAVMATLLIVWMAQSI